MKIHPSFKKVIAAARKELAREQSPRRKRLLDEAIRNVNIFINDNYEFIGHYGDDAEME